LVFALATPARASTLEDWPCPGCITVAPDARVDGGTDAGGSPDPRPLLVALHGDGGAVRPLVRAWQGAAAAAGVVLLAVQCPRALGCRSQSFWQWLASSDHDPAWLGAQIDAVEARFAVDRSRVFATGYSGGATYVGWWAPAHASRIAAVAHVAGGAPYRPPCPACKTPVLFVLGASDPMIHPFTAPLRDWYQSCGGHEIEWETIPGVTHESILGVLQAGRAAQILRWLLARPLACAVPAVQDPGTPDASVPLGVVAPIGGDGGEQPAPPPLPSPVPRVPPASGCACRLGAEPKRGSLAGAAVVAAFVFVVAGARPWRAPRAGWRLGRTRKG
jgi:polyhydroxybutyrate depolymerase